jgi:hypothetical protein
MAKALRKSVAREERALHNEAFVDGVCHAIDALKALGYVEAAEVLLAKLFKPTPGEGQK